MTTSFYRLSIISALLVVTTAACHSEESVAVAQPQRPTEKAPWVTRLEGKIKDIDQNTPGNLGVYVKKLGSSDEMGYQTDRAWYFASTVKVPVAIATLERVEEGKITLDTQITIKASDPVDGSGEVQFKKPGSKVSIAYLLEKMLTQSDSTATDILIRSMGVDELNSRIKNKMNVGGFNHFTTILQVRQDAFGNLHPRARELSNRDFIDLKKFKSSKAKFQEIARRLHVKPAKLNEKSIEAAFEKYYETGLNSGSLKSYGLLLERLSRGELLKPEHTQLIFHHMLTMTTGENRIKAGLPNGVQFAQKTGTQVSRICNVGITFDKGHREGTYVVTACLEKFTNFSQAEQTLKKVGQALAPVIGMPIAHNDSSRR